LAFAGGVGLGDGAQEGLGVLVLGGVHHFVAGAFFDDLAAVHDGDVVADVLDDGHVVADEEVGELELVAEIGEEVEDLALDADVEGAGGFVADDEAGLEGERTGDADALALAAGELVGVAVDGGASEAAALEEFADLGAEMVFAFDEFVNDEGLADDGADAHAWVQGAAGVLEDDLHLTAEFAEGRAAGGVDVLAVEGDGSRGGGDEAEDGASDGGLAAAGLADEAECFSGSDVEGDAVNGLHPSGGALEDAGAHGEVGVEVADAEEGGSCERWGDHEWGMVAVDCGG